MKRKTAIGLTGTLIAVGLLAASAWMVFAPRLFPDPWRLLDLDLDIELDPAAERISALGVLRIVLEEGAADRVVLDLDRGMTVESIEGAGVAGWRGNLFGSGATVRLTDEASAGDQVELSIGFTNTTDRIGGNDLPQGVLKVDDQGAYALSGNIGWHPTPVGSRGIVAGTTRLTVPEGWRARSNGRLVASQHQDGRRSFDWASSQAVERGFVAGPFVVATEEHGGRELSVYFPPDNSADTKRYLKLLRQSLEVLEDFYGALPFDSYSIVAVSGYGHGAESQQDYFVTGTSFLFAGGEELNVALVAHELAHAWWGDWVRRTDPGGRMVSEGLAQYSAALAIEVLEGPEARKDFLLNSRPEYVPHQSVEGYFQMVAAGQDRPLMQADGNLANTKGHWVYHMLRHRIGDELFFSTLRELIARHGGAEPISMNVIREAFLDAASPEHRLEAFFEQWLERTGAPDLQASWEASGEPGNPQVAVTISQRGEPYDLVLDLAVRGEDGERRHRVSVSGVEETFVLSSPGKPIDVQLDPDHQILRRPVG